MSDGTQRKLFVVTVETELIVVADDERGAELAAGDVRLGDAAFQYRAITMSHMPSGWDEGCIPFGDGDQGEPDRSVGEWIRRGAAPKYTEAQARLKAARARLEGRESEKKTEPEP